MLQKITNRLRRKQVSTSATKVVNEPVDGHVIFEMATRYANEVLGMNMTKDEIMFSQYISGVQIVEWHRAAKKLGWGKNE